MLKPFKVSAHSVMMNAEMNCALLDDAFETYNRFKDSPHYYEGDIISNYTGEVYAHFSKESDAGGITITEWIATN